MTSHEFYHTSKAWAETTFPGCDVISTNRTNRTISGFWPIEGDPKQRLAGVKTVPVEIG